MQTYLIIITHLLPNDSKVLKGGSGSILLHAGGKKVKTCFVYSLVSSPLDRSKHFTLYPLADLFIPTSTRLLCEAFWPCSNYAQRLITCISTTVYSQVLIYENKIVFIMISHLVWEQIKLFDMNRVGQDT